MQALNLKNHKEILKELDKLEEKLHLITDYYKELEILRQKRKYLVENLSNNCKTKSQLKITPTGNIPGESYLNKGRSSNTSDLYFIKDRSLNSIYHQLEDLSFHHKKVEKKINDIQTLRSQTKTDTNLDKLAELDNVLAKLHAEKKEVEDKIVRFVIQHAVIGMEDTVDYISNLEEENNELQKKIIFVERKFQHVNDTITSLMIESHSLKEGREPTRLLRKTILHRIASLDIPSVIVGEKPDDGNDGMMIDDGMERKRKSIFYNEDITSVDRVTIDSFALDAQLASWKTDEKSTNQHVQRIGENLHAIVLNQMKLNIVKEYVCKYGTKDITFEKPHVPLSYQGIK